jgi:hypothetical protein
MDINKLLDTVNHNDKTILINFGTPNQEIVGRLVIENNQFRFEGNGNLSAQIFFNEYLKPMIDNYINNRKISLN